MRNPAKSSLFAISKPKRQGFYEVRLTEGDVLIAEWRERDKAQGKVWWQYVSEDPCVAKQPKLLAGVVSWRDATKQAIELALKRELTVDERIEAELDAYYAHRDLYEMCQDRPPACRQLKVGDAVEVGALRECTVAALRDEGSTVVFSYRHIEQNYGQPIDHGIAYRAYHWTEVSPTASNAKVHRVRETVLYGSYHNTPLSGILMRYRNGMDDNPDYQRGYAWTEVDKARFLDSLFQGRELGRFIFVRNRYPRKDDILDGKQRLHCLWQFFTSQLAFEGVYWHELSARDRDRIEGRSVQYAELSTEQLTRADFLRIFLEVNAAGVPQSEEHLDHVKALLRDELAKTGASGVALTA